MHRHERLHAETTHLSGRPTDRGIQTLVEMANAVENKNQVRRSKLYLIRIRAASPDGRRRAAGRPAALPPTEANLGAAFRRVAARRTDLAVATAAMDPCDCRRSERRRGGRSYHNEVFRGKTLPRRAVSPKGTLLGLHGPKICRQKWAHLGLLVTHHLMAQ